MALLYQPGVDPTRVYEENRHPRLWPPTGGRHGHGVASRRLRDLALRRRLLLDAAGVVGAGPPLHLAYRSVLADSTTRVMCCCRRARSWSWQPFPIPPAGWDRRWAGRRCAGSGCAPTAYLWHFPIIVLDPERVKSVDRPLQILQVVATIIVAASPGGSSRSRSAAAPSGASGRKADQVVAHCPRPTTSRPDGSIVAKRAGCPGVVSVAALGVLALDALAWRG